MIENTKSVIDLIGNTPLVQLHRLPPQGCAEVWAKLEYCNPSGSVKDRAVLAIVTAAEAQGLIHPGFTLLEASGGNTGISLGLIAPAKGCRALVVTPATLPAERRKLLQHLGVTLHLTPPYLGMAGAEEAAKKMVQENLNYFLLGQFSNPANPEAHRRGTGAEILSQLQGQLDAFVAGVGTGGTITGVGEAVKAQNPKALVIAVEPARSPLLSKGRSGPHGIPGLGADFFPSILNRDIIDEVIAITDEEALSTAQRLCREEGLLVGVSSGANVAASIRVAERLGKAKRVVTVLPDTADRYLNQFQPSAFPDLIVYTQPQTR